jgi:hypothetical protein
MGEKSIPEMIRKGRYFLAIAKSGSVALRIICTP